MATIKPVPNEEWDVRFGPQAVNFLTDTEVILGRANNDGDHVIALEVAVLFTNVNGTLTVQPVATVDTGTTGQVIASSTTFTNPVENRYTLMVIPALAYQVTGNADTTYFRLLITANAVGQATTLRARTDNIATITTGAAHNLSPGDETVVSLMTDTSFNGRVTVLDTPTATTFTYYNVGPDVASVADAAGRIGAVDAQVVVNALYMGDLGLTE